MNFFSAYSPNVMCAAQILYRDGNLSAIFSPLDTDVAVYTVDRFGETPATGYIENKKINLWLCEGASPILNRHSEIKVQWGDVFQIKKIHHDFKRNTKNQTAKWFTSKIEF